jgi:hypothetical protein
MVGIEGVVERHRGGVEEVERLHSDNHLHGADERQEVVAPVDHGAPLRVATDRERGDAVGVDVVGAVL